jgi:hypothetical protein
VQEERREGEERRKKRERIDTKRQRGSDERTERREGEKRGRERERRERRDEKREREIREGREYLFEQSPRCCGKDGRQICKGVRTRKENKLKKTQEKKRSVSLTDLALWCCI